jgi:hypothetical protein
MATCSPTRTDHGRWPSPSTWASKPGRPRCPARPCRSAPRPTARATCPPTTVNVEPYRQPRHHRHVYLLQVIHRVRRTWRNRAQRRLRLGSARSWASGSQHPCPQPPGLWGRRFASRGKHSLRCSEPVGQGAGPAHQRGEAQLPSRRRHQRVGRTRLPRQAGKNLHPERPGNLVVGIRPSPTSTSPTLRESRGWSSLHVVRSCKSASRADPPAPPGPPRPAPRDRHRGLALSVPRAASGRNCQREGTHSGSQPPAPRLACCPECRFRPR